MLPFSSSNWLFNKVFGQGSQGVDSSNSNELGPQKNNASMGNNSQKTSFGEMPGLTTGKAPEVPKNSGDSKRTRVSLVSSRRSSEGAQSPLDQIHDLIIQYSGLPPLSPQSMALRSEANKLRTEYKAAYYGMEVSDVDGLREKEEPEALVHCAARAQQIIAAKAMEAKINLIVEARPNIKIERLKLRKSEFDAVYKECSEEAKVLSELNQMFERDIGTANVRNYPIAVQRNGQNFCIDTGGNKRIGYTVHDILRDSGALGDRGAVYTGNVKFDLTAAQLRQVHKKLHDLQLLGKDFSSLLTEFLKVGDQDTSDVEEYIEPGQKPVSELLKSKIGLSPDETSYFQSRRELHDEPVLLLSQRSLNLSSHPTRDLSKCMMEQVYASYEEGGLKDSKGAPKTFIENDPYRSILSVKQFQDIYPFLQQLTRAKQQSSAGIVRQTLGTSSNPIKSPVATVTKALTNDLVALSKRIDPNQPSNNLQIEVLPQLTLYTNFKDVKTRNDSILDQILDFFGRVDIPKWKQPKELTTQDKFDMLGSSKGFFGSQDRSLLPSFNTESTKASVMAEQSAQLFGVLKNTQAYRSVLIGSPELASSIDKMESEFKRRIDTTTGEYGHYGKGELRRALERLEEYVAQLHFSEVLQLTPESIEQSFRDIAAQFGGENEDTGYCATGFGGRVQAPLSSLKIGSAQFKALATQEVEKAYQTLAVRDRESSMYTIRAKQIVLEDLGLNASREAGQTSYNKQGMASGVGDARTMKSMVMKELTPGNVYASLEKFARDEFWKLASSDDDTGVVNFLTSLGFKTDSKDPLKQFHEFRVNGDPSAPWQFAHFKQQLPYQLIDTLMKMGIMAPKTGHHDSVGARQLERQQETMAQRFGQSTTYSSTARAKTPPQTRNNFD